MLVQASIERTVKQIVAAHFKTSPDVLRLDSRLREDLGGDSLDLVELVFDLEQSLDVTVAEGAVADLETVGDAVRYVRTLSR